ncbi:MAG TPA: gamma-glutamyl-gamma-aminobutyrate hydrolase family protein [Pyrinomonadaceae bacterium]|nr:gamma-glutamyl-gamma-aminobutyrate hydrolase family protein [Pyrinomonadaceae bacterium]
MTPLIGIVCKSADNDLVRSGDPKYRVARPYRLAIESVGLKTRLIPTDLAANERHQITGCNGYVLAGGASDVSIGCDYSGAVGRVDSCTRDVARDQVEQQVVLHAREHGNPLLCICRGMQLLNNVLGGKTSPLRGHHLERHRRLDTPFDASVHTIQIAAGSGLRRILGANVAEVNSAHGFAVSEIADQVSAAALSEDGIVEAIEVRADAWTVGVQWHPEALLDDPRQFALFKDFARQVRDVARLT